MNQWKATEFRTFLVYVGPLVLKNIVDLGVYEHFFILHTAITILMSTKHISSTYGIDFANELLKIFVQHCAKIYGHSFYVYNIHNLIHLCSDAGIYGCLDNFSAFPCENFLRQLKQMVRATTKPLQQLHNRILETNFCVNIHSLNKVEFKFEHGSGPVLINCHYHKQFKKIILNFVLSIFSFSVSDCYCLTSGKKIIEIHNILVHQQNNILLLAKIFQIYSSFYMHPQNSKSFGIYCVENLSDEFHLVSLPEIIAKCVVFPISEKMFIVSIITHTFT